jgi:hypothetical protein
MKTYSLGMILCLCTGAMLAVQDFIKIPATNMTQSEAHLSIPWIRKIVEDEFHINDNPWFQQLWLQVIERERQFNHTHYVFYSATSNVWRLPQDLFLKLYLQPLPKYARNFRVFRFINKPEELTWEEYQNITVPKYLKYQLHKFGMIDDRKGTSSEYLISANVALFGNVPNPDECSFIYFLNARNNRPVTEDLIRSILKFFHASEKYVFQILKLMRYLWGEPVKLYLKTQSGVSKLVEKTPGTMYQIFIPKEIIDQVAYISWVKGLPYDPDLISLMIQKINTMPAQKAYNEIRYSFKSQQMKNPLFRKVYAGIDQGRYSPSGLLSRYKNNPTLLPHLNYVQARLLVTPQYMRKYTSNIQTFAYDNISPANKAAYEKELDILVSNIITETLNQYSTENEKYMHKKLFDLGRALKKIII